MVIVFAPYLKKTSPFGVENPYTERTDVSERLWLWPLSRQGEPPCLHKRSEVNCGQLGDVLMKDKAMIWSRRPTMGNTKPKDEHVSVHHDLLKPSAAATS